MMDQGFNFLKKLVAYLLIASLGGIFYNNLTNRHYHKLTDGRTIYHAHPFNKDANTSHTHTNNQYSYLQSIFDLFNTVSFAVSIAVVLFASAIVHNSLVYLPDFHQVLQSFHNKAPPVFCLS
jgi:hypothetical protein